MLWVCAEVPVELVTEVSRYRRADRRKAVEDVFYLQMAWTSDKLLVVQTFKSDIPQALTLCRAQCLALATLLIWKGPCYSCKCVQTRPVLSA
jgi:hypothetical protein